MGAFLAEFIQFFNDVDNGPSGVLNYQQLQELAMRLSSVDDIRCDALAETVLLEARDKLKAQIAHIQCATFSECVTIFGGLINARWAVQGSGIEEEQGGSVSDGAARSA